MKKTLLIAAAALVAGVISSEAQVYSANVVGYVNVATPAGSYIAAANPLDLDGVDSVTNVLAGVPKGTTVQFWNGTTYSSITRNAITGNWPNGAGTNLIPPGVGFFIKTPSAYTNTFVGNVIPNSGASSSIPLAPGVYTLVGSPMAVSGQLTDTGTNTLNLGVNLAKGSVIQIWNGSAYQSSTKNAITGNWGTNLTISVAQGIFVKPAGVGTSNWVQNLQ